MKKSAAKKKGRSKQRPSSPGPWKQPDPLYASVSQRERETVREIINGGQTADKALEVGLSALIFADHTLRRFDGENDLPRPLACTEGCDHCCFNQVELTPPEALVLGNAIERGFSEEERDQLLGRVQAVLAVKTGKSKREIAAVRGDLPCPLLREHRCLLYPLRPLVCRGMHSLEVEPCARSLQAGDLSTGAYYAQRHELVRAVARGLAAGCRDLGCQSSPLDLAQAVEDYFRQPDPAGRWIRGEKVFKL